MHKLLFLIRFRMRSPTLYLEHRPAYYPPPRFPGRSRAFRWRSDDDASTHLMSCLDSFVWDWWRLCSIGLPCCLHFFKLKWKAASRRELEQCIICPFHCLNLVLFCLDMSTAVSLRLSDLLMMKVTAIMWCLTCAEGSKFLNIKE